MIDQFQYIYTTYRTMMNKPTNVKQNEMKNKYIYIATNLMFYFEVKKQNHRPSLSNIISYMLYTFLTCI